MAQASCNFFQGEVTKQKVWIKSPKWYQNQQIIHKDEILH